MSFIRRALNRAKSAFNALVDFVSTAASWLADCFWPRTQAASVYVAPADLDLKFPRVEASAEDQLPGAEVITAIPEFIKGNNSRLLNEDVQSILIPQEWITFLFGNQHNKNNSAAPAFKPEPMLHLTDKSYEDDETDTEGYESEDDETIEINGRSVKVTF